MICQNSEILFQAGGYLGAPRHHVLVLHNILYTNINYKIPGLPTHPATVDGNQFARNVAAGTTGQEDNHTLEVLRFAPPAGGNTSHDTGVAIGIVDQRNIHVGINVAGSNGIDVDALGHPLVGKSFGQLADTTLGGRIGGDSDATLEGQERCDVDNIPATAGWELGFVPRKQIGAEFTAEDED